ncbi:hypothetical protein [Vampirovibrio chlorellavorus]|uniref:hypothetical protein n=1 Tax=Vampirovibrio chlorellavorus TaxID=758823 RepID=UPI0026EB678F|nr:hypothetical protein [Vampirovibrio chlorellavorus]
MLAPSALLAILTLVPVSVAQQLDLEFLKPSPPAKTRSIPMPQRPESMAEPAALPTMLDAPGGGSLGKPLTVTVSKTLYLPPAMYGQWSVTGIVKETNITGLVPVANDLWVLQRQGDEVTITNPVNGASASIQVDAVEGNTATFHRSGQSNRINRSETVTLTVNGDTLYGRNMRREEVMRKGQVVKVNYALFELQGTRIGGARAVFRPEALQEGPDLQIDEVKRFP